MKSRRSRARWDFRSTVSAFQRGRVLRDYLTAAAILSAVAILAPNINHHELLSCNGFVVAPSRTTTTMAIVSSAKVDTLETLTEKLTILLSVNEREGEDEGQNEERRLDLFRTKLSVSTNGNNTNDESDNRKTSVYINNARVDTSTIKNAGRGLFATVDIKEGQVVTCYPGDAIVRAIVDCKDSEITNHDLKDRSNWVITWGDHISADDLDANGVIGDDQVLPDDLLPYIIHVMDDYGILGLPLYSSRDANDDTTYLGHFANDGASNIPVTVEDLGPYIIESCEVSNAVNKDLCGCHMVTVATRDIQEGEEIFVVYGPGYWMDANQIKDYDDDDFELDYHFDDDDDEEEEDENQRAYYDN